MIDTTDAIHEKGCDCYLCLTLKAHEMYSELKKDKCPDCKGEVQPKESLCVSCKNPCDMPSLGGCVTKCVNHEPKEDCEHRMVHGWNKDGSEFNYCARCESGVLPKIPKEYIAQMSKDLGPKEDTVTIKIDAMKPWKPILDELAKDHIAQPDEMVTCDECGEDVCRVPVKDGVPVCPKDNHSEEAVKTTYGRGITTRPHIKEFRDAHEKVEKPREYKYQDCPNCKNKISFYAGQCQYCGYFVNKERMDEIDRLRAEIGKKDYEIVELNARGIKLGQENLDLCRENKHLHVELEAIHKNYDKVSDFRDKADEENEALRAELAGCERGPRSA